MNKLVLGAIVVCVFVWFADRYYYSICQRDTVEKLESVGGQVLYENQRVRIRGMLIPPTNPPGPKWFHPILGEDFFDLATSVACSDCFCDADVKQLRRLRKLKQFRAEGSGLTDLGVTMISKIESLESVNLANCYLTDTGVASLGNLSNLKVLQLWNNEVTDGSIDSIAKLKQLKHLGLEGTLVTKAGVEKLRASMPNCKIGWQEPLKSAKPVNAKYSGTIGSALPVVLDDPKLKPIIKADATGKTKVYLDSSSTRQAWPEKLKSADDAVSYIQLNTPAEVFHQKRLAHQSETPVLFLELLEFKPDQQIRNSLYGPFRIGVHMLGGETQIRGRICFELDRKDGKVSSRHQISQLD